MAGRVGEVVAHVDSVEAHHLRRVDGADGLSVDDECLRPVRGDLDASALLEHRGIGLWERALAEDGGEDGGRVVLRAGDRLEEALLRVIVLDLVARRREVEIAGVSRHHDVGAARPMLCERVSHAAEVQVHGHAPFLGVRAVPASVLVELLGEGLEALPHAHADLVAVLVHAQLDVAEEHVATLTASAESFGKERLAELPVVDESRIEVPLGDAIHAFAHLGGDFRVHDRNADRGAVAVRGLLRADDLGVVVTVPAP